MFKILTGVAPLLLGCLCQAGNQYAPSCSYYDVSNTCYAVATPGDTVVMPPGTNVWSNTLWLPAGISLFGSGTNVTHIVSGLDASGYDTRLIFCNALTNVPTRISNFSIDGTFTLNANTVPDEGIIWMNQSYTGAGIDGNAVPWRIDHLNFNNVPAVNIKVYNVHSGLIDSCSFTVNQPINQELIRLVSGDSDQSGSYSYSIPYSYGGTNALYIENCYFTNANNVDMGLFDIDGGGSVVFRHNTAYNFSLQNHGTEGTILRSVRSFEIYNNTLVANYGNYVGDPAMLVRGGTGVIFSNTIIGWKYAEQLLHKRVQQWCSTFDGADGLCPWDLNDTNVYLQGVWSGPAAAATNNYTWLTSDITFTNIIPWTNNQWAGYVVVNTNAAYYFTNDNTAPVYWFGTIVSNTTNTLSVLNPKNSYADQGPYSPNVTFNPGDHYQFRRVLRTLDQIGLGSGDYIASTNNGWTAYDAASPNSIPPLANEVDEPLYWWSNTLNSASSGLTGQNVNFDNCGFAVIQANRDFYNDTPKPGYSPLPYPYPNPPGGTNAQTTLVGPTTNLRSDNPPVINIQPQNLTILTGQNFSLTLAATGTSLNYAWLNNNVRIPGATNSTYAIPAAQLTDAGNYTVIVTNPYGSVTSATAVVTVNAAGTAVLPPTGLSVIPR